MFVGRMGKDELAAVSLSCLTANVTGWAVFQGLASALDTLCPQAHGARLYKLVGLHTQRMTVLLLLTSIPIAIFWYVQPPFLPEPITQAFIFVVLLFTALANLKYTGPIHITSSSYSSAMTISVPWLKGSCGF
jgi:Na+-driven multidrug efflux pump